MMAIKASIAIKKTSQNGKNKENGTINSVHRFISESLSWKLAISFSMSLILAIMLYPQILHLAPPQYRVGSIITKDVQADRDFLVVDKAATEQKRAEAVESTKPVYDYDSELPVKIDTALSKAFLDMRNNLKEDSTKPPDNAKLSSEEAKKVFEDLLGISLTAAEFETLNKKGFSADISNNIVRLIYYTYSDKLIGNRDTLNLHKSMGITIRNIGNQEERELNDLSSIIDAGKINTIVRENAKTIFKTEHPDKIVVSIAQKVAIPNLTFAKNSTEKRKQTVADEVKPVLYKLQKNEMIIREGEKITPEDLDKLDAFYKGQEGNRFVHLSIFSGIFLTIIFLSVIFYRMASVRFRSSKAVNTDLLFMGIAVILQVILTRAGIFICDSINLPYELDPSSICIYVIPFTTATMLVAILVGRNEGLIFAVFSSLVTAFLFEDTASMFLFSLIGCAIAVHRIIHCERRSAFFKTGLLIGAVNMVTIICISLLSGKIFTIEIPVDLAMGILGGLLSGFIVSGLVPLFEFAFGYTTDIKLLELANLNQPIFQELLMTAPGTYHHSVIVASLVEAAAEEIGVNSLLAKVSAYYHDIGKMKKPHYFIENQSGWKNKHDDLSPQMSSLIIISHVKDGCELAKEHNLGKAIQDIIRQHHGTGLVRYFYDKAKEDGKASGQSVQESDFRYPGPKPQSKEAGLIILGDIVEASSRTLTNPTPARIRNLVDSRIKQAMEEGQLDESDLTFSDLKKISETFTRVLTGIFHRRIDYKKPSK